ncbi:hypothetical protein BDV98DRAFT_555893 [Pterulicium gracile]|uniref:NAD(P)-binding protein n=1 Tax=Pterulicium gracile TaxID=1884261 RepID=A0A5C3Q6C2_9AGAR|nr:hypothetical protein BDV98DRAFT_555893 [Pterula gracilis]
MSAASKILKPVFIVSGVGSGSGTGSSAARVFAKAGYSVALIARNPDSLKTLAEEIKSDGGEAIPVPVESYEAEALSAGFKTILSAFPPSTHAVRGALYNTGDAIFKPFLEITPAEHRRSILTHLEGGFVFGQEVIRLFLQNEPVDGRKGTLIFTGATAGVRGGPITSSFSAGKHGIRALSQSLAKEFGRQDIHVAHCIIDGRINSGNVRKDIKQMPSELTAKDDELDKFMAPVQIAENYLWLVNQHKSTWTWELDLRPAHEKW